MKWPDDYINKVICGDCLDVMKGIPDNSIDFVLTSPPYNIGKSVSQQGFMYKEYKDNLSSNEYYVFLNNTIKELLRITKNQIFFNIQYVSNNRNALFSLIGTFADNIKDILIWEKLNTPATQTNVLSHNYEFVIVFANDASTRAYNKDFGRKGVYRTCFYEKNNSCFNPERFACESNFAIMSIQLAQRIIKTFTVIGGGEVILDPFAGSGTTLVACKQNMKKYIGIDISQEQCEVSNKRLQFKILGDFI